MRQALQAASARPRLLSLAAGLIIVNGIVSIALGLKLERSLLVASVRTVVQLLLIGFVLNWVFRPGHWYAVAGMLLVMTVTAGVSAVDC